MRALPPGHEAFYRRVVTEESASNYFRVSAHTLTKLFKMELSKLCDFDILNWLDDTDELTDYLLAAASEDYESTHALTATPPPPAPIANQPLPHIRSSPSPLPRPCDATGLSASAAATSTSPTPSIAPSPHSLVPTSSSAAPDNNTGSGPSHCSAMSSNTPSNSRFAIPKTNKEIVEARKDGVPQRTQQDTLYCTRLWDEWCKHRDTVTGVKIVPLIELSESELNHQLTSFILEVRKKDGSLYTPNSLHHLVAGLVRDLRQNGRNIDIFKDPGYSTFRASLDAEMKRISREGIGSKKKQAEIITEEEEELLWVQGLLGDETPQRLLDTVVFYNGLYFTLRSGLEHRQLRRRPCQIEVVERPNERPYLLYTEDISKNRPGGLKGRNTKPKVVKHHANLEVPHRCFVRLFKMYQSLCP